MLTTRTELPRYQIAKAHFKNKFQLKYLSDFIRNKLPEGRRIAVICIGSSRSTGDSLGPSVGTLLSKYGFTNVDVYGTIKDPVHALNLEQTINKMLLNEHPPFIIAVDSSLGRNSSIGILYWPFLIHYQWLFKLGPSTFGMEILSNTKNSRPDKISDFLIIEWDIGGVNMRNHGQYLIMINRDHTNVEVV